MMKKMGTTLMIFFSLIIITIILWIIFQKTLKKISQPNEVKEDFNENDNEITMITYNIQKFPVPFKSFEPIKNLLNQYSIILLQECFDELFSSLETYFPNYYICRGTLDGINVMNSGLVILSVYPILKTSFTCFTNVNTLTFDALSEKGYLSALIEIPGHKRIYECPPYEPSKYECPPYDDKKRITIVNTHLQSCDYLPYDPIALLQLEEILNFSKKIEYPYIIGGDFNVDINVCKTYKPELDIFHPSDPTIYINFKNGHSKSCKDDKYEGLIFDYFIVPKKELWEWERFLKKLKNEEITIKNIKTLSRAALNNHKKYTHYDYSDHNPVAVSVYL